MLTLIPIRGIPLVQAGDDMSHLVLEAMRTQGETFQQDDVLVLAQKIVSKAEGCIVRLEDVTPSPTAIDLADQTSKDPRLVELILREAREVVRIRPGLVVVEDRRGFICANAGIDRSNVQQHGASEEVALLPPDPDASARLVRDRIQERTGVQIGVLINDSHGRAFREGTVGVAIGLAGIAALSDRRGDVDLTGYTLQHTVIGIADEIAGAASLIMGPAAEGVPAVLVRGLHLSQSDAHAVDLQRPREMDLFR